MTDMTIANTIAAQIGRRAFTMLGARDMLGGERQLTFKIRGSKRANCVRVTLTADDLYDVEFIKIGRRGLDVVTVNTAEGIYADMLHDTIETNTGLYTRL